MTGIVQDLRYATRTLMRRPAFTAVVIAVLALGIGANAAIFSVINAVLLRPLPFPEPERLVEVHLATPGGDPRGPVSAVDFEDWRETNHVFQGMALVNSLSRGLTRTGAGEPEQLPTAYVHPAFFATLGVSPALGRALRLDENEAGRNRVAVLSHRLWLRDFGGDPSIAGRTVTLDGEPFTVTGVMPASFRFPGAAIDVWAPESLIDAARAPRRRDNRFQRVIARLAPGVTLEAARAEMGTIAARLAAQYPETNAGRSTPTLVPLRDSLVGESVRSAILILLAAVVLVLLIACANVGNLLLERALARRHEIAVRLALGAGRARIVRQVLAECVVLAGAGGALGLAVGAWSIEALLNLARHFLPAQNDILVDGQVLGFTLLISLASALVFGAVPAIGLSRTAPQLILREDSRSATAGPGGRRLRAVLMVAETALAVVLVVGAVLMVTSFARLRRVDPGFDPGGVLTVSMNASSTRYPERPQFLAFYREVLSRIRQIPGVLSAGSTRNLPLQGAAEHWPVAVEGQPPVPEGSEPVVPVHQVSPDYLRAMRIPLLQGRDFTEGDLDTTPDVALVSRSFARRHWPAGSAVGRTLRFGERAATVVGVCGDVRQSRLDAEGEPAVYVPQAQSPRRGFTLVLRAPGDPLALAPAVRGAIRAVDPEHPILRIGSMEQVLGESVAQPRLLSVLLAVFGGLALCLAMLGVYGVMSCGVALRTREFGVRMALGARPRDVLGIVLGQGARLALTGVAIGTAAALGLTRLLSAHLFEIGANDATTFVAVAALLFATSLVAGYLPARRATRVDPLAALRDE
jgi:putative ABC transport system permease protein